MNEEAQKLLMMFIRDGYSASGNISKPTALAMMKFVRADKELQRLVNMGDWKSVKNYSPGLAGES